MNDKEEAADLCAFIDRMILAIKSEILAIPRTPENVAILAQAGRTITELTALKNAISTA